jgi:hypothetical protein
MTDDVEFLIKFARRTGFELVFRAAKASAASFAARITREKTSSPGKRDQKLGFTQSPFHEKFGSEAAALVLVHPSSPPTRDKRSRTVTNLSTLMLHAEQHGNRVIEYMHMCIQCFNDIH